MDGWCSQERLSTLLEQAGSSRDIWGSHTSERAGFTWLKSTAATDGLISCPGRLPKYHAFSLPLLPVAASHLLPSHQLEDRTKGGRILGQQKEIASEFKKKKSANWKDLDVLCLRYLLLWCASRRESLSKGLTCIYVRMGMACVLLNREQWEVDQLSKLPGGQTRTRASISRGLETAYILGSCGKGGQSV